MKISSPIHRKNIATLVGTLAAIALPFSAIRAHEGHDHKHSAAASGPVIDAWKAAQASLKGIETAAAAKEHEPIHNEQEKLAAALKQIQENHGAQGADKTRLEGALKNALTASEKVHTAADAKDFTKVDSSLKTLQSTMALLEKQITPPAK